VEEGGDVIGQYLKAHLAVLKRLYDHEVRDRLDLESFKLLVSK
jgi:hypothetical protein